jgi:hypothetical protein
VKFILNNVNLTIAKKFSQSLFILTFGSLEGLREFEILGRNLGEKKPLRFGFSQRNIFF